jgi:hypothetical protein
VRIEDDSDGFQFWGSEMYRRDVPMNAPGAHSKKKPMFAPAELESWEVQARVLNAEGRGDQFAAVLAPV